MLELYHHGSSACAAKVRLALAEKHLEWTGHYVDILRGEQFRPEFIALNPKAVVPVLVHDGFVLAESTLICEYVDEVFAQHPLLPRDAQLRARVRQWTKAVDEELHPACSALTYIASHRHTLLRNGVGTFDEFLQKGGSDGLAARTLKWQWIHQGIEAPGAADKIRLYMSYLTRMERALRESRWLVGDAFTMADVAMAPYLNRLDALSLDGLWSASKLPRVADWFERVRTRPTFKSALIDWVPAALAAEMRTNGAKSWPAIEAVVRAAG